MIGKLLQFSGLNRTFDKVLGPSLGVKSKVGIKVRIPINNPKR